jgi:hypothetical protein
MPAFVVKVTLKGGGLLPPISASTIDEQAAIALVQSCKIADAGDKVEVKGIRGDVMKAAFGEQPDGTATIRGDWIWDGDKPAPQGS